MEPRHARPRPGRPGPALLAAGAFVVTAGVLLGSGVLTAPDGARDRGHSVAASPVGQPVPAGPVRVASPGPVTPATGAGARAAAVLHAWDRARAAAWSRGSVRALRRLYVGGAGASDVRLLRGYRERGLCVEGLRVQVLALDVLDHRPGAWRVRVTDRVAGGTAVGGGVRQPLPRDQATERTLRLVRVDGRWRIAAVS